MINGSVMEANIDDGDIMSKFCFKNLLTISQTFYQQHLRRYSDAKNYKDICFLSKEKFRKTLLFEMLVKLETG